MHMREHGHARETLAPNFDVILYLAHKLLTLVLCDCHIILGNAVPSAVNGIRGHPGLLGLPGHGAGPDIMGQASAQWMSRASSNCSTWANKMSSRMLFSKALVIHDVIRHLLDDLMFTLVDKTTEQEPVLLKVLCHVQGQMDSVSSNHQGHRGAT